MKKLLLFLAFFLIFFICYAEAQPNTIDTHLFLSPSDAQRFQQLTKEIRCVVCQYQNIAESNAPLANDLREKVYRMILAQQSDEAIKHYFVKRYGEFILLQPRFTKSTAVLWLFPLSAIVLLFIFFLCIVIKQKKAHPC